MLSFTLKLTFTGWKGMKIIVSEIKDEGLEIDAAEEVIYGSPSMEKIHVIARVRVERERSTVYLTGNLKSSIKGICSRCLDQVISELNFEFSAIYLPEASDAENYELKGGELEIGFYTNNEIDLTELLQEQIALNMPIKALCSDACKGLCSKCGVNLNFDRCECKEETDERWKILNTIFAERKV
jgi:uncharacterized protein